MCSSARTVLYLLINGAMLLLSAHSMGAEATDGRAILKDAGTEGGLVVHIGCGDGKLTTTLRGDDRYLVHGLDRSSSNIEKARKTIRSLDLYGPVSVELWSGRTLPYEDNMVNLVVVEDASSIPMQEVMRVLVPRGIAYVRRDGGWEQTTKPANPEMDEWTHYLHDAGNNAVSSDSMVASPHQLRWVGGPRWVRHHDHMSSLMAEVSAGGRLFYIFDEGNTASMQFPARWAVIARDAFNGKVLWKRRIEKWHPSVWPGKFGPASLPRRLVASGDRVYVTLGIEAPLSALDAATGETIRTYGETASTEEVLFVDGTLFLVVNKNPVQYPDLSFPGLIHDTKSSTTATGWIGSSYPAPRREPWIHPDRMAPQERLIMAVDAETGGVKWSVKSPASRLTLTAGKEGIFFHDSKSVVCLDPASGKQRWRSESLAVDANMNEAYGPTLVLQDGVILFASAENWNYGRGAMDTLTALSAETGRKLWSAPHPPSGYASPEDTLVINGLVWTSESTSRNQTGAFTARDLKTGEIQMSFPGNDGTHMPHHRCYRAKATERLFLMSRTGIEFVDPLKKHWDRNDWVRGSCQIGIMPANGLVYAGPHSCACYMESKLEGRCALTASRSPEIARKLNGGSGRHLKGPAFGLEFIEKEADANDWPTYRQNQARTGSTVTEVAAEPKPKWTTKLNGRLSAPVVSDGRLFVAAVDEHTLYSLSIDTGAELWNFVAAGRIDSPPTVWRDLVVFGSADGCVYALRTSDGAMAWRFRAVPADRRIVAFGQLESQWPVHGSVLIRDGLVNCVSGRSMFFDGGLRYLKLDAATGKLLSEEIMDDRNPTTGKELDAGIRWPTLPVAMPDILSCDGTNIFMRSQVFDLQGKRIMNSRLTHLFSPTGFLDGGAWWHRTYWVYDKTFGYGASGHKSSASRAPAGRILVMDNENVYGFAAKPPHMYRGWTMSWYEYQLFGMKRVPAMVPAPKYDRVHISKGGRSEWVEYTWTRELPCLVRSMVLAGDRLFVAGPPRVLDERKSLVAPEDPDIVKAAAEQEAAWRGQRGGLLLAIDSKSGSILSRSDFDFAPSWDGLMAAQGCLFMSTLDGSIVCLK